MAATSDRFLNDGLGSLRRYFLYGFVSMILLLAMTLVTFLAAQQIALLAGVALSGLSMSPSQEGSIGGVILLIAGIGTAAVVLGTLCISSLVFGLRDIRRSKLGAAAHYAGASQWMKWLLISAVVLFFIAGLVYMVGIVSMLLGILAASFSATASSSGAQLYIEAAAALNLVATALMLLAGYKLSRVYAKLAVDVSQRWLAIAGFVLLAAVIVFAVESAAGAAAAFSSPSVSLLSQGAAQQPSSSGMEGALGFIWPALLAVSAFLGWRAIKAAIAALG